MTSWREGRRKSAAGEAIKLTAQVIGSFEPARIFRSHAAPLDGADRPPVASSSKLNSESLVTSASFRDDGEQAVTVGRDDTLCIYSCVKGELKGSMPVAKYGAGIVRYTHSKTKVLTSSTKTSQGPNQQHRPQLLDIQNNKYLTYFEGHGSRILSMEMAPDKDIFASSAVHDTVRLWDIKSGSCIANLKVQGRPLVAWDPSGAVFAIAFPEASAICMYDVKALGNAPFKTIRVEPPPGTSVAPRVSSVLFANRGDYLLVGTDKGSHYVYDSFRGNLLFRLKGQTSLAPALEADLVGRELTWTPDAKFVLAGSADGRIAAWEIPETDDPDGPPPPPENLSPTAMLQGYGSLASVVAFNPTTACFLTGGTETALWLPDLAVAQPKE